MLSDLVPAVDENVWALGQDPRTSRRVRDLAARMIELGVPFAVFVSPADRGTGSA